MGLLSFFKRQPDIAAEAPAAAESDAVAAARTRARRRLLGATVLLGLGVIGFPLLFETQPRPVPINIPIEIARKDGAPPLVPPGAVPPGAVPPGAVPPLSRASAAVADEAPEIVERAGEQGRDVVAPAVPTTAPKPAPTPAPKPAVLAPAPGAPAAVASKPTSEDGARARALLDGQSAASAPSTRVVVQVGAYTEPAKLAEARQRVEKLGFKTYTQVVQTDAGQRTRVRVGPFATRAEADQAAARIKASGLPAAILAL